MASNGQFVARAARSGRNGSTIRPLASRLPDADLAVHGSRTVHYIHHTNSLTNNGQYDTPTAQLQRPLEQRHYGARAPTLRSTRVKLSVIYPAFKRPTNNGQFDPSSAQTQRDRRCHWYGASAPLSCCPGVELSVIFRRPDQALITDSSTFVQRDDTAHAARSKRWCYLWGRDTCVTGALPSPARGAA